MGRVTGVTLVALGLYVVYSAIRFRRDFRLQSRWMLVLAGARRTLARLQRRSPEPVLIEHSHEHHHDGHHHHEHDLESASAMSSPMSAAAGRTAVATKAHVHTHRHVALAPTDPFTEYGTRTTFLIGMMHGVGAETPTQVILMTTAAGLTGSAGGVVLLAAFVTGLFAGNTVLALAATFGLVRGPRMSALYVALAATAAVMSIYVGSLYALGRPDLLPAPLGG
jgi:high-affinity nickel-transport protein